MPRGLRHIVAALNRRLALSGFRWLFAAAILIPGIAFCGFAWLEYRSVLAETYDRLGRRVDMLDENARRLLEGQEGLLIGSEARVEYEGWAAIPDDKVLHALLNRIVRATPTIWSVFFVNPVGRLAMASSAPVPAPPFDVSGRDYFRFFQPGQTLDPSLLSRAGSFAGEVIVTTVDNHAVFTLTRPTLGPGGERDGGVVGVTILQERIVGYYARIVETKADKVAIVRSDGAVLARYPAPPRALALFADPATSLMLTLKDHPEPSGFVNSHSVTDGVDRILGYRRVEGYPVVVVYGVVVSAVMAQWYRLLWLPGAGTLGSILLLTGLTLRAQAVAAARLDAEIRRAEAEKQLRHMERVAAAGQLAAGVAHDFRNAAQAMISAARLIRQSANNPEQVLRYSQAIGDAGFRASALTDRMMNFTRREGEAEDRPYDLRAALAAAANLLRPTLGPEYRLAITSPGSPEILTTGSAHDFESAVINLVVNARDAMPDGGCINLACHSRSMAAGEATGLAAGCYAAITVSDTGTGMDAATLARATEAFFSTKPAGKGNGLGLASVRGFAERSLGAVTIASEPGAGTTVSLFLPVYRMAVAA
jgi:two-component system NtrC family sensor kinase